VPPSLLCTQEWAAAGEPETEAQRPGCLSEEAAGAPLACFSPTPLAFFSQSPLACFSCTP